MMYPQSMTIRSSLHPSSDVIRILHSMGIDAVATEGGIAIDPSDCQRIDQANINYAIGLPSVMAILKLSEIEQRCV